MNRSTLIVVVALAVLAAPGWASADKQPTGRQIVDRAFAASRLEGAEMVSTLTILSARGEKRERKTVAISKLFDGGKTEKRLIRFLAPADVKGTGLLTYDYEQKDDDIWFFLPALRKTRRIVSSERAKSFMGSEFTYADLAPPSVDDFTYKLLRTEKVGAVPCWVVESAPRDRDVAEANGYSRRIAWIGQPDHVLRRAQSYDLEGKLERELMAARVTEVDTKKHRFRPLLMTMKNVQTGRSSVMDIEKLQPRDEIPDDYFTTRYLERP